MFPFFSSIPFIGQHLFNDLIQNRLRAGLLALFTSLLIGCAADEPVAYDTKQYDQDIVDIYQTLPTPISTTIDTRIPLLSASLLGKPFALGALGEGSNGRFDQQPLYRTDEFDCLTYVETVLALAHADNLPEFRQHILDLRYAQGQPSFLNRNHFMSVDWIPNNTVKGYVRDITDRIVDHQGSPVAEVAVATINKPAWYQHFTADALKLQTPLSSKQTQTLLIDLHNLAQQVQQHRSALLYVPFTALFDKQGQPDFAIFDQIPSGAIVNIVRPNWPLQDKIGTHLNVSHTGFAIRTDEGLMYRHASTDGQVLDIPLTEYLQNHLTSPTIKGIHLLQVEPR
ncbi:MAG: DUF1460 domain-containing protein [Legionellales bacterium]|nr:DUF1460 domain-containing protein [Legionellales bacterium]